ncbi:hypothetical protein VPH35_126454 [Triticum aestivum]
MEAERPWRHPRTPSSRRSPSNSSGSGRIRMPAAHSRPPCLAWFVGHSDVVIFVTGSSATDGWPPPRLDVTPPTLAPPIRAAAANTSTRAVCQISGQRKAMAMKSD